MVTYEQWNKAIISYFFEDHEDPDEIVFLQTDANTLFDIAIQSNFNVTDANEATDSLAQAVRDKMVRYDSVILSAVNPTKNKKEPPQVAFLALTVLAASRMNSEGSTSFKDYYTRLNKELFDQSIQHAPQGFDRHYFEELWMDLHSWVRHEYDLDLYLNKGPRNGWCVWYPKSQCLITKHEQRSIYLFFRRNKLTPFSDLSEHDLERRLRYWMLSSTCPNKIKRYLSHEIYKKAILRQVISLLRNWDNVIPPKLSSHGRQMAIPIDVEFRFKQFDSPEIRYWFRKRGADEVTCEPNCLGIKRLRFLPSSKKWFRPEIDNTSTFWNRSSPDSLHLRTGEINPVVYTLGLSDIWVFREDSERDDGWLSQRNMKRYEDHLIIFRKRLVSQVIDCLKQTCEQEFEEPSPIDIDSGENDWLYLRAEPTKFVSFSEQHLWKLSVDPSERINFIGGLSVKNQDGRKAYLDFCLPTVFVPDLGLPNEEFLSVGDQAFPVHNDRFVTLDNTLEHGSHLLTYGKQTRELRVIGLECSLEHHNQTLIAAIPQDRATIPSYTVKEISEISEEPGIWLTGAKFFGDISLPVLPIGDKLSKVPAHIISSVVKVAIDLKQSKGSVPEWFDEAIDYLEQDFTLRVLVEKKLNLYHEMALSYMELRKQIGK